MSELGSRLMRAREARGLTLEDAERDTRISRRYLQALETDQLEVIPAPVYARGFLRSYAQYLGLDPQAMLALFPREEDTEAQQVNGQPSQRRASVKEPLSAVGPARPSWRKPDQPGRRPQPRERDAGDGRAPARPRRPEPDHQQPGRGEGWEPTIGVDIGVPAPARRIKPDAASQTRAMTVLIAAVAAIVGVVLVAFLISRLGSDEQPPGAGATVAGNDATRTALAASSGAPSPTAETAATTVSAEPGKVPDVRGLTIAQAKTAVEGAGFVVKELRQQHAEPRNTVYDQAPAPNIDWPAGATVTLSVSEGP